MTTTSTPETPVPEQPEPPVIRPPRQRSDSPTISRRRQMAWKRH